MEFGSFGVCGLQGCSEPITAQNRVACGNFHHLLLMVSRYLAITRRTRRRKCSTSPSSAASRAPVAADGEEQEEEEEEQEEDDNTASEHGGGGRDDPSLLEAQWQFLNQYLTGHAEVCLLPSCHKAPWPGHRCCGRTHFLQWLISFYQVLCPQQICGYPLCTRHVFVEEAGHGHGCIQGFCGWKHRQKYEMRTALGYTSPPAAPTSVEKGIYPSEPSIEALVKALKNYISNGSLPQRGVRVDEDFFSKHPWQVLQRPADEYCLLIARCVYKEKGIKRELMTKEDYHWKQQGRPTIIQVEGSSVSRRYLTYQKLQATKKREKEQADLAFNLTEWTITDEGYKDYCLLKLAGQVTSMPNRRAKSMASCESTAESTGAVTQGQADKDIIHRGQEENREMISCREESSMNGDLSSSAAAHLDPLNSGLEPLQNFLDFYSLDKPDFYSFDELCPSGIGF